MSTEPPLGGENYFGQLLRAFRESKDKTQFDLSMSFQDLGYPLDATSISKYESGARHPDAEIIPYFAKAIGLSEDSERALLDAYVEDFRISALESYLKGKDDVGK